ncbi:hypothetical protein ABTH54_20150, partial [Acinetobacter baumannii]
QQDIVISEFHVALPFTFFVIVGTNWHPEQDAVSSWLTRCVTAILTADELWLKAMRVALATSTHLAILTSPDLCIWC